MAIERTNEPVRRNWPIVEALAEFLLPDNVWRDGLPDSLHEDLRAEFPIREKVEAFTHQFEFGPGQHDQSTRKYDRHQFFTADRTKLVQIDRVLFAVNHLKPYASWEDFVPLIDRALVAYRRVVGERVKAATLQYINRMTLQGHPIDIAQYFEFRPRFEGAFSQCACTLVQPWIEENGEIVVDLRTEKGAPDTLPVLLILSARRGEMELDSALPWLNAAHEKLDSAFKASITAKARAEFVSVEAK